MRKELSPQRYGTADIVLETVNALKSGVPPERVINDQTLGTLRDRSVRWMVQGYHALNKPELIRKAFALCAVPGTNFNLSYESLTSCEARQAILDLRTTDPQLYAELATGSFPRPTASDVVDEDMMIDSEYVPENEDVGHGAAEVIDLVLNARSAGEAAESFEEEPQFEEEDDSAPLEVARDIRSSSRFTLTP
ncbi:hypothetical protein FRC11_002133 [Ceratobasidium sp. 423]|nr:hypothetical protein FRC11_002133 [Ceratobasidium sp. 423]